MTTKSIATRRITTAAPTRAKALSPRDRRLAAQAEAARKVEHAKEADRNRARLYHARQRLLKALAEVRDVNELERLKTAARAMHPKLSNKIRARVTSAVEAAQQRVAPNAGKQLPVAAQSTPAAAAPTPANVAVLTADELRTVLRVQTKLARAQGAGARAEALQLALNLADHLA